MSGAAWTQARNGASWEGMCRNGWLQCLNNLGPSFTSPGPALAAGAGVSSATQLRAASAACLRRRGTRASSGRLGELRAPHGAVMPPPAPIHSAIARREAVSHLQSLAPGGGAGPAPSCHLTGSPSHSFLLESPPSSFWVVLGHHRGEGPPFPPALGDADMALHPSVLSCGDAVCGHVTQAVCGTKAEQVSLRWEC